MILKRIDGNGKKYYVNAFTGRIVNIRLGNPLKREPNSQILSVMNPNKVPLFGSNLKHEKSNKQKTVFVGDFKRLIRTAPRKRDKKEFIKACKRVNVNPWPLLNN